MAPVPFPVAEDDVAKLFQAEVNSLTTFSLTKESLAELFHVPARDAAKLFQVKSAGDVDKDALARAGWLAMIALRLGYLYEAGTAAKWLNGTNAFLGDRTPMTCMREGRYSEVISAIEQEAAHSYA